MCQVHLSAPSYPPLPYRHCSTVLANHLTNPFLGERLNGMMGLSLNGRKLCIICLVQDRIFLAPQDSPTIKTLTTFFLPFSKSARGILSDDIKSALQSLRKLGCCRDLKKVSARFRDRPIEIRASQCILVSQIDISKSFHKYLVKMSAMLVELISTFDGGWDAQKESEARRTRLSFE